jgi:hypothetical protein
MVYADHPFLKMLKKDESFVGRNMPIPITYGNVQNRSRTATTTLAGSQTSKQTDFLIDVVDDFNIALVEEKVIRRSANDKGAFANALTHEIDNMLHALSNNLAFSLFRDSSGYRAQVSAEPTEAANTVITVKSEDDIVGFEVGQTIVIYSAKSGGTQRSIDGSTTDLVVDAVDRDAGTITATGQAYDSSGTIAADDYIFVKGDRGSSMSGLESWLPATAPTSGDSFFGVDRSVDPTRLAGQRLDATGLIKEEAVVALMKKIGREGGRPDVCFMSYEDWKDLELELGSKVQYVDSERSASVGFRGIVVHGPKGVVECIPDQNCPQGKFYMLQMDTWKLVSMGGAPSIFDRDGNLLRQASAWGVEIRGQAYVQLACRAPGYNGVAYNVA